MYIPGQPYRPGMGITLIGTKNRRSAQPPGKIQQIPVFQRISPIHISTYRTAGTLTERRLSILRISFAKDWSIKFSFRKSNGSIPVTHTFGRTQIPSCNQVYPVNFPEEIPQRSCKFSFIIQAFIIHISQRPFFQTTFLVEPRIFGRGKMICFRNTFSHTQTGT